MRRVAARARPAHRRRLSRVPLQRRRSAASSPRCSGSARSSSSPAAHRRSGAILERRRRHSRRGRLRDRRRRHHRVLHRRRAADVGVGQRRAARREARGLRHRAAARARRRRRMGRARDACAPTTGVLDVLAARPAGRDVPRAARAGVHRLAGTAAEGVRRARRPRRAARRRPERARPVRCSRSCPALLGIVARGAVSRSLGAARPRRCRCCSMHALPPLVGALGLAAVFSAEISAADAVLFMLTTSLSQDLYKRFLNPTADDGRVLRVSRGGRARRQRRVGVALAIVLGSVVDALTIFYTLLGVSAVRADRRRAVRARARRRRAALGVDRGGRRSACWRVHVDDRRPRLGRRDARARRPRWRPSPRGS